MVDPELALWVKWHARLMVVSWVVLLPLGILIARYFKITPRQRWPQELDNKFWWRCHLRLQYCGVVLMSCAAALASYHADLSRLPPLHGLIGFGVVLLGWLQVVGGWLRGSKGGPKGGPGGTPERAVDGDHYDMTPRRLLFERVHKFGGYLALSLATVDIALGLWMTHAAIWIDTVIAVTWLSGLAAFSWLQHKGRCIDTYQAIWGPGREHPGNRIAPVGWGIRRLDDPASAQERALAKRSVAREPRAQQREP